jgi:hypothetical protein
MVVVVVVGRLGLAMWEAQWELIGKSIEEEYEEYLFRFTPSKEYELAL